MYLFSHYDEDVEEFARRYGRPMNRQDDPLVSITLEIAKSLFKGCELEEKSNGSILVGLNDGKILALICLPNKTMNASAYRRGKTYFVAINIGTIEVLFDLSISIWKDQRFLSHLRHDLRGIENIVTDFIPSGFERIYLDNKSELSNEIRRAVFYQCFEQAISFFWLHETAHILRGHLDLGKSDTSWTIIDEFLSVAGFDDEELEEAKGELPYYAFEIEADRWALDRLFGNLHQKFVNNSSLTHLELITTTIGCTLFPLSLHGYKLLRNESDLAKKHPPLWFRADEVMKAEDKAANDQWFNDQWLKDNQKLEDIRFRQKHLVQLGLAALSQVHPMFGEWLSPVAELSRQAETERILNEARSLFEPWRENLSRCRRTLLLRPDHLID